jgi:hypothetical protein
MTNEDRIRELREELAKLEGNESTVAAVNAHVDSLIDAPSIISSPALTNPFYLKQPIAFINDKIDVVPGYISQVNRDGTYDLKVLIPRQRASIKFDRQHTSFDRVVSMELVEEDRLKARPNDPTIVFRKQAVALVDAQRGTEGVIQTHIDQYLPSGNTTLPRFHDFHTSLVGSFFDPSLFFYKVWCWRAELEIQGQKFPAEEAVFPSKKPYFENFGKAFNRFFREYHQGMSKTGSKWNRVEIQVKDKRDFPSI